MVIVAEALETNTPTLKTPAPNSARSRESAGGQGQSDGRLQVGDTYDLLGVGRRHKLLELGTAPMPMLQEEATTLWLEELVNDNCERDKSRLGTESGSSGCQVVSG